jgi:hypothetical protein
MISAGNIETPEGEVSPFRVEAGDADPSQGENKQQ